MRNSTQQHKPSALGQSAGRKAANLLALLTLIAILPTDARATEKNEVPRMVVNILVDQLRSDYLQAFMPLYGEGGFKELLNQGQVYSSAEYPMTSPDRASAAATIATGTSPSNHGVIGLRYLNRATLRPTFCIEDQNYQGIGTTENVSPSRLLVSTIGDELKVATKGEAHVYAIAPHSDVAVLTAGHAADAAVWIDNNTGEWVTSSFYEMLPPWAKVRNQFKGINELLSRTTWRPSSDLVGYFSYFLSGGMHEPFEHKFKGDTRFHDFKTSGLVNEEIAGLTKNLVENSTVGVDIITDYLAVTFYAGNYLRQTADAAPTEMQDIYVRLDKSIAQLIACVNKKVGKENALFVLSSTGYADCESTDLKKYRIPTGTFDMRRATGLLNMYLIAVYGQGQYVDAYYGKHIYFNHKVLEDRQINITDITERAQDFLLQLSGVKDVYSAHRLVLGAWAPGMNRRRNSYNVSKSGDVVVEVLPGWRCINDNANDDKLTRESYFPFPIIFYGYNLPPAKIETPVTTDYIAPTLARAMRIRAPNGCANAPLVYDEQVQIQN